MANRATDLTIGWLCLCCLRGRVSPPRPSGRRRVRPSTARYPVAIDTRVGGDASQTRFVMDFSRKVELRAFTLADPYRVVIDLPQVGLQAAAQDRRNRSRPDQGVSLRPRHAGRLAHRARRVKAGANRQGLRARRRGRPAGAAGDRSRRHRPRNLHAHAGARTPAAARHRNRRRWSTSPRTRAIRARSSCSIPATAASTIGTVASTGDDGKVDRARLRAAAARPARKDPASTAW